MHNYKTINVHNLLILGILREQLGLAVQLPLASQVTVGDPDGW